VRKTGMTMPYGSPTQMNADGFVNGRWGNCCVIGLTRSLAEWCCLLRSAPNVSSLMALTLYRRSGTTGAAWGGGKLG
jgi:hypothetical protein